MPDPWVLDALASALMYATLATAWNMLARIGYLSLGSAAFFGLGGYGLALLLRGTGGSGYLALLLIPLVGVLVALVGVPVGALARRVPPWVFPLATIALLVLVRYLAVALGGLALPVPPFPVGWLEFAFCAGFGVLLVVAVAAARSTHGKLLIFGASAGLTAVAGGLWALYQGFIYPDTAVDPVLTLGVVAMAGLGGRATLRGPVLAALAIEMIRGYLDHQFGISPVAVYLIGYAVIVVGVALARSVRPGQLDITA